MIQYRGLLFVFIQLIAVYLQGVSSASSLDCSNLTFDHGEQQRGVSPFRIDVQNTSNSQLDVTLTSNDNSSFQGFILQARRVGTDMVFGTFVKLPNDTKAVQCNSTNDTATHSSNNTEKFTLTFRWSPDNVTGKIVFKATVAANYSAYWLGILSEEISLPLMRMPGSTANKATRSPSPSPPIKTTSYVLSQPESPSSTIQQTSLAQSPSPTIQQPSLTQSPSPTIQQPSLTQSSSESPSSIIQQPSLTQSSIETLSPSVGKPLSLSPSSQTQQPSLTQSPSESQSLSPSPTIQQPSPTQSSIQSQSPSIDKSPSLLPSSQTQQPSLTQSPSESQSLSPSPTIQQPSLTQSSIESQSPSIDKLAVTQSLSPSSPTQQPSLTQSQSAASPSLSSQTEQPSLTQSPSSQTEPSLTESPSAASPPLSPSSQTEQPSLTQSPSSQTEPSLTESPSAASPPLSPSSQTEQPSLTQSPSSQTEPSLTQSPSAASPSLSPSSQTEQPSLTQSPSSIAPSQTSTALPVSTQIPRQPPPTFEVEMTIDQPFDKKLDNKTSKSFKDLSAAVKTGVETVYKEANRSVEVSVKRFRSGSVIAELSLKFTTQVNAAQALKPLQDAVNGKNFTIGGSAVTSIIDIGKCISVQCDKNAECNIKDGSCICNEGFTGDGKKCTAEKKDDDDDDIKKILIASLVLVAIILLIVLFFFVVLIRRILKNK